MANESPRILEAALALVDAWPGALSMRKLGAELGVDPMLVYKHVANKGALLDGLAEEQLLRMTPREREAG